MCDYLDRHDRDAVDYIDGNLTGDRLDDFLKHLSVCAECSRRIDGLRLVMMDAAALETAPSPQLRDAVIQGITNAGNRKRGRIYLFIKKAAPAVAVFAVVLMSALYFYHDWSGELRKNFSTDSATAADNAEINDSALQFDYKSMDESLEEEAADDSDIAVGEGDFDAGNADNTVKNGESEDAHFESLFSVIPSQERYQSVVVFSADAIPEVLIEFNHAQYGKIENNAWYITVPVEDSAVIIETLEVAAFSLIQYGTVYTPEALVLNIAPAAAEVLFIVEISQ